MMSAILAHDISVHNRVMPGDSWGPTQIMDPSYIAPAEYAAFAQATGNSRWQEIATQNVQWLQTIMNAQTGLVPDWLNADGSSPSISWDAYSDDWYYDAVRTPIRLYLAARSGNEAASAILQTEFQWMSQLGAGNIVSGYTLAGTPLDDYQSGPFLSAAAAIGAMEPQSAFGQASLAALIQWNPQTYYGASLRAVTLAELAGSVSTPAS
jgi:endo-1,4-beta-D-glucanase Y